MPIEAKLSIVNYGFNIRSKMDPEAKKEDDNLISAARSIITKHNFGKGAIMVTEAYHTDLGNSNNYIYPSENMTKLIKSFYDPFNTPFLCYHDDYSKPIGTNILARFFSKPVQLSRGVASGYGKIATFIPESSVYDNEPVVDLIQQRRFMAVSIGSKTHRNNMICTICGSPIYDCEHIPGKDYEGQKCFIKLTNPIFTECSMAGGNPADIDAMTRRMDCFDTVDKQSIESFTDMIHDPWSVAIYDNAITSQFPGTDISGTKDTESGEDTEMPKSIAELVESYETRISDTEKDKDVLVAALTSANKKIVTLQDRIKEMESSLQEDETENLETTEENDSGEENENSAEGSGGTEEPAKDTADEDKPDETAAGEENKNHTAGTEDQEKQTSNDEGAESQSQENTENSSEKGTETEVKKQKSAELLRGMRASRMSSVLSKNTHVVSKTYRAL